MLLLRDLRAPLDVDEAALAQLAAQALHVPAREVRSVRLVRRALDARKKQDIHLRLHLLAALDPALEASLLKRGLPHVAPCPTQEAVEPIAGSETPRGRIAVAGLGPAGLFAAWLLARQGYRPLVIERGRPVEERAADVERFWAGGALLAESNAMFGEGGAGTFSDGKLTSRSKDPRADTVLRVLAEHGAPEEIRYLAKPHIGTDRLRTVVRSLRRQIESLGGEVRFSARWTALPWMAPARSRPSSCTAARPASASPARRWCLPSARARATPAVCCTAWAWPWSQSPLPWACAWSIRSRSSTARSSARWRATRAWAPPNTA